MPYRRAFHDSTASRMRTLLPRDAGPSPSFPPVACCRNNVDLEKLKAIETGRTSRREVLLLLGEPDQVWLDETRFEYTDEQAPETRETIYLYVHVIGQFIGTPGAKYHYVGHRIYIEFDEHGIVSKREFHRYERSQGVNQVRGHTLPGSTEDWIKVIK